MKRLADITGACLALLFLSPLMAAIGVAVRLADGGPVIFSQERIGRGLRTFRLYKFRTMAAGGAGPQITAADDPRITPVGSFLRRTKLDELPQLVNVVKGDMSLVGPRPEMARYVALFPEEFAQVLAIRPGITDFAALEFFDEEKLLATCADREKAYVEELLPRKLSLYREYLDRRGFLTDSAIICRTMLRGLGLQKAGAPRPDAGGASGGRSQA